MTSGRYASKLPAYSSASTTNASPAPRRAVAGTPSPVRAAGRSAPTNAPGIAAGRRQDVDEPARGGALAVRPGDRRPAAGRRRRRRRPAARARAGSPRSRAAASSALPGSIAVSALVTASRAGGRPQAAPHVRRVVRGRDRDARRIERRACTGPGRPGRSRRPTRRPTRPAAPPRTRPRRRRPTTWIRSPGRIGRGVARRAPGRPRRRPPRGRSPARPRPCSSSISSATRAESRLFSVRSPGHRKRRTDGSPSPGDRDVDEARRAWPRCRRPGPATPVTATPRSVASRERTPSAIATRDLRGDRPVGVEHVGRDAELALLDGVRVRDDAADEVRGRPGDLRDHVGDQPAGARLGRREGQPACHAPRLQALGELDERVRHVRCGRSGPGGSGGANSHVSGLLSFDMWPRSSPLSVKNVALDFPVRTSTESLAVNVTVLPGS